MIDRKEKLDIKSTVRALAEYVMLNSVATDSTSLFYGRAGMSISLFETARYLDDKFVEDYAYTLLKQSLLNEKKDIRFDAGLSGIGYALAYLIRNKFIDADFFEIYQSQHNIIVEEFLRLQFNDMELKDLALQWQQMYYFHYVPDQYVASKIRELQEISFVKFRKTWKEIRENSTSVNKELVVSFWKIYLKAVALTNRPTSYLHIKEYLGLVQDGILKRDIQSLHYISVITRKARKGTSSDRNVFTMIKYDISDFYATDSLEVANLFSEPYMSQESIHNRIRQLYSDKTADDIEEIMTRQLGLSTNSAVLSFGVSGLILGLIYMETHNSRITNEILSVL